MKLAIFVFLTAIGTVSVVSAQTPAPAGNQPSYVRPGGGTRFRWYVDDTVGPFALAGIVAGSGFGTLVNTPREWGRSGSGFGKRIASDLGKNVIRNTVIYGLDEAFKLDSHFYRSRKRDLGSRVANALLSTVTARRSDGKRVIGVPRLVGSYTADMAANELWYPSRYHWHNGFRDGTFTLGVTAFFNLVKEFVGK
jgi:hypothetical protein